MNNNYSPPKDLLTTPPHKPNIAAEPRNPYETLTEAILPKTPQSLVESPESVSLVLDT